MCPAGLLSWTKRRLLCCHCAHASRFGADATFWTHDASQTVITNVLKQVEVPSVEGTHDKATMSGSIAIDPFLQVLHNLRVGQQDVFVDLGSGSGLPTIMAGIATTVRSCIGVEIDHLR